MKRRCETPDNFAMRRCRGHRQAGCPLPRRFERFVVGPRDFGKHDPEQSDNLMRKLLLNGTQYLCDPFINGLVSIVDIPYFPLKIGRRRG